MYCLQTIVFQLVKGLPYRREKDPSGPCGGAGPEEEGLPEWAGWALGWRRSWQVIEVEWDPG